MIVYVVTTRTDIGRRVKAVFEDRDQAIYCCALFEREDAELEELDTDALKISGNKTPLVEWIVCIRAEGSVADVGKRYTFDKVRSCVEDIDGSCVVRMTHDRSVDEDIAVDIMLEYWQEQTK